MSFDDNLENIRWAYRMGRAGRTPYHGNGATGSLHFTRHEWAAWRLGFWHRREGIK